MTKKVQLLSEYCFYIALFIELTLVILDKSQYVIQYEGQWFRLSFVLFLVSMLSTRHSFKEWICYFISLGIGMISYKLTGRNEIIRIVTFIWACQNKDMMKVLKGVFWYTLSGCAVIFMLSVTGIYGDAYQVAVYREIKEIRYSFGMGHANAFHCMLFVLTLLGLYCYAYLLKWYHYIILMLIHVIVFLYTDSKTGFAMSIFAILMTIILRENVRLVSCKYIYILGILIILMSVLFSVICAKYIGTSDFIGKIDKLLTGRILCLYETKNHEGMLHTWKLWSLPQNTYYFDMGIVRIFYWYGIIPGIIYLGVQCRLIWCAMKKTDYMTLMLVVVITIYSIVEAHFVSVFLARNYIFFVLGLYLKDIIGIAPTQREG